MGSPPSSSRASSGKYGAKAAAEPDRGRGGAGAGAGAGSAAAASAAGGGPGGAGWNKAGGQLGQEGGSDGGKREWHREELVLLMEAAMANPHQWDAVARQVGGGRTPGACMKRFLDLAVEEVVKGGDDEKKRSAPASSGGATAAAASSANASASASDSNGKGAGVGQGGSRNRKRGQEKQHQQPQRPPHLGQAVPALVLASTLASNVHPEVLMAAMAAATEAADALARRSAAATPAGAATANQQSSTGRGGLWGGSSSGGTAGVAAAAVAALKGESYGGDDQDEDVEMRDVGDGGAATAGSGQGVLSQEGAVPGKVANGEKRETGAGTTPQREGPDASPAWDFGRGGSVGSVSVGGLELAGAARATVLSVAGLHARGLAEQEDRRTEALLADLLEARWVGRSTGISGSCHDV